LDFSKTIFANKFNFFLSLLKDYCRWANRKVTYEKLEMILLGNRACILQQAGEICTEKKRRLLKKVLTRPRAKGCRN